jgi:hypothetical protein
MLLSNVAEMVPMQCTTVRRRRGGNRRGSYVASRDVCTYVRTVLSGS